MTQDNAAQKAAPEQNSVSGRALMAKESPTIRDALIDCFRSIKRLLSSDKSALAKAVIATCNNGLMYLSAAPSKAPPDLEGLIKRLQEAPNDPALIAAVVEAWRDEAPKTRALVVPNTAELLWTLVRALTAERLRAETAERKLNTPELHDFAAAVALEGAHQRERWGSDHDAGKTNPDWFWLVGYLAGKALASANAGDTDKALHHVITTAAALANWHAALNGDHNAIRPGIMPPDALASPATMTKGE